MTDENDDLFDCGVVDVTFAEALTGYLDGEATTPLYEAARHLPENGGKRLRPALVRQGYEVVDGDDIEAVVPAAVAVELVHTCSLSHDDIIDDDDLRRGTESVHTRWDVPTGILAGDLMYARAFDALCDSDASRETVLNCCTVLADTCSTLCEGQMLDIQFEDRDDVSETEYVRMAEYKTGALLGASLQIGALLGGANEELAGRLREYGSRVGVAFQIQDDVLDITQSSPTLGKERGSDIAAGKVTLITVHAREQGVDIDGAPGVVRERLDRAGSIEYARERARDLVAEARASLCDLPDAEAEATLHDISGVLVSRGY